ncbi:MAG: DUF1152 domain-containing protein, partial [Oscillochloris sp.]|nr:DUF1152 domain-containing protein [Oscillochloris sp.]
MLTTPLLDQLQRAERVLIAGAGGGFDVFSGLPIYFGLRDAGKAVFLANLSFSFLPPIGERLSPAVLTVTNETPLLVPYFPERHLVDWFETLGEVVPIYAFERTGVRPLRAAYQALVEHLQIDTLILVDGGTDSLMRGDEAGLGTPGEDMASIVAASALDLPRKMLVCMGLGVDSYHGVGNAESLAALADFTRCGAYLGTLSLLDTMPAVQRYRAATEYVCAQMPGDESIVCTSILAALAGCYGNHHPTARTFGSTLWINPLMPLAWSVQLDAVAARLLYRDTLCDTESFEDVRRAIMIFRHDATRVKASGMS